MSGRRGGAAWVPVLSVLASCVSSDAPAPPDYPDSLYVFQRVGSNALVLQRGFRIAEYAVGIADARGLALAPDGSVYVTQRGPGLVVRLVPSTGGGDAVVERVLEGLRGPHGIAFRGDTLWVAEEHRVTRYPAPYGVGTVVVDDLPTDGGHSSRTILLTDEHLYVSIGSSCNLCDERDPRRAAVVRYDFDGGNEVVFATGLRNSVGLARHPMTGAIWATNNDRDRLGDDRPPDRVNVLTEGGWYGWPQCFLPDSVNPEYAQQADRCSAAIGPEVLLPAHTAPLGLRFYTGTTFPQGYRGDLFIALHGSWDRSFPVGYKVVRVPIDSGGAVGPPEDFVVGWLAGRQSWGRPVDLLVMPDGAMLVSDDAGGRVYRVWWAGTEER